MKTSQITTTIPLINLNLGSELGFGISHFTVPNWTLSTNWAYKIALFWRSTKVKLFASL